MDEYLLAARVVHFAAALLLCGTSLFPLYARSSSDAPSASYDRFKTWSARLMRFTALAVLISGLAWWDALAAYMSDGWSGAVSPEMLATVLLETFFGQMWMWRLALAVVLLVLLSIPRPWLWGRPYDILIAALAVILTASLALAGHAAMHDGVQGAIHQAADAVHLLSAGIWLGGLAPLGYLVLRAGPSKLWWLLVRTILPRFSRAGYAAVGLLLITGVINSTFLVSTPSQLMDSAYGRVLLGKVSLFGLLVGLAAANRFLLVPKISARAGDSERGRLTVLSFSIAAEQTIGLAVIVLAAILGRLPPPH